jgi:hypothetical protein
MLSSKKVRKCLFFIFNWLKNPLHTAMCLRLFLQLDHSKLSQFIQKIINVKYVGVTNILTENQQMSLVVGQDACLKRLRTVVLGQWFSTFLGSCPGKIVLCLLSR